MSTHIGLAFCVDKIYFARFIKKDHTLFLDQLGSALYPFPYNEPDLFNEENKNFSHFFQPLEKL